MRKKLKMLLGVSLVIIMILTSTFTTLAAQVEAFSDVPSGHWAYQSINNMVRLDVIKGYPDSTFKPDKFVSREEFAKILCGATNNPLSEPKKNTFLDVPTDHWAFKYVETVKDYLTGYPSNNGGKPLFKGTQDATREDVAVALVKIKGFDKTVSPSPTILDDMYKDVYTVSSNLKNLMAIAVEKKLITGYPDGTIRGTQTVTRAEAAVLIDRANSIAGDVKVPSISQKDDEDEDEDEDNDSKKIVYLSIKCNDTEGTVGEKLQFSAVGVYSNGKTKTITNDVNWKSLNESICSANGNGQITLLKAGETKIRISYNGKSDEQKVKVYSKNTAPSTKVKTIKVTPDRKDIYVNDTYNLKVEVTYEDGKTANVTNDAEYESNNTDVATVSSTGKVTGLKEGIAQIKATYKGAVCYAFVIVNQKNVTLESIKFPYTEKSIKVGESISLQVIGDYSDSSIKDITDEVVWVSSNSNIARVSVTGQVYGVDDGQTTIKAEKNGKRCQMTIKVTE